MKTIRQSIQEISIYAFLGFAVIMFTSFILYSLKKTKVAEEATRSDLQINMSTQVKMFLPSYLLPEQKSGLDLILKRIKKDENLDLAVIFQSISEIPVEFPNCSLNETYIVNCLSADSSMTAVVAPLNEGDQNFGFFLKAKKNSSAASMIGLVQVAGAILLLLGISFMMTYFFITKLVAKNIPLALDNLVDWIETEMHQKGSPQKEMYFQELADVKSKISEVILRYNQNRNQAVIGQVTSGIMHDIKTPLQSIVSATFLVNEQEQGTAKRISRLENLFRMCTANLPIVGEIIETTLDGNRNIQVHKTQGNINDLVASSLKQNHELSRLRNVSLELVSPEEITAYFDQNQFLRVINNLIKNGIESAGLNQDSNPKVRITIQNGQTSEAKIIIEDSGLGFSGSTDNVFSAFRTTKTHGSGLGLMISKKIVDAHSGVIKASNSSSLGGARVEVLLPTQGGIVC